MSCSRRSRASSSIRRPTARRAGRRSRRWHGVAGCLHCRGARGLSDGQVSGAGAGDAGRGHGAATAALQQLIAERQPVLVDVLPSRASQGPRPGAALDRAQAGDLPARSGCPISAMASWRRSSPSWFARRTGSADRRHQVRPLVFYCDANCWMSWNAAKRAMDELGYSRVYWYPTACKAGNGLVSPW